MLPFVLATASRVAPSDGQVNWLLIIATLLGIIVSVTVIVAGIKTAVRKMMMEIADERDAKLIKRHVDPLMREVYEIKGELRSHR